MFTTEHRSGLLEQLVQRARVDQAVAAAALVGSAARKEMDPWSDIDLALGVQPELDLTSVADDWARALSAVATVADHLDVWSGPALYRVFLLDDSLQVDLSFWPVDHFGSTGGEPFELLFGDAAPAAEAGLPDLHTVVGWAWLYALHARSAIARRRNWQAVQMLDGLRSQVVTLACLRHDLPGHQGRGVDKLPDPILAALSRTLVPEPNSAALAACFAVTLDLLLAEAEHVSSTLAARLRTPLAALESTASLPDP